MFFTDVNKCCIKLQLFSFILWAKSVLHLHASSELRLYIKWLRLYIKFSILHSASPRAVLKFLVHCTYDQRMRILVNKTLTAVSNP